MTETSEPDRPRAAEPPGGQELRATPCGHDVVSSSGIMPGPGGEMHEVGLCSGCALLLRRFSPLEPWVSAEDDD